MRSRSTRALAALIAVFALTAVGVAQASAHEFIASVAGTLATKGATTFFDAEESGWHCHSDPGTAPVVKGSQKTIKETLHYELCEVPGEPLRQVGTAEWEFNAERTVTLLKTFHFEGIRSKCTITFEPSTGSSSARYFGGTQLNTEFWAEDFKYTDSGGTCGTGTGVGKTIASMESRLPSGTIEWK
jgi:hypothetical protein